MSKLAAHDTRCALIALFVFPILGLPRPVEAAPAKPVQLEVRNDSGRLQLDAARHRVLAAYIQREANTAGIAVESFCGHGKPCPTATNSLLATIIGMESSCRLGLFWRTPQGLRRATSPDLACTVAAVTRAVSRLMLKLSPAATSAKKTPASHGDSAGAALADGDSAALALAAARPSTPVKQVKRAPTANRREALRVLIGPRFFTRDFDFNDPVKPSNPPSYKSGLGVGLGLTVHLHPGAFVASQRWFSDFGLRARYATAIGLRSQLDVFADVPARFWQFDLALTYRWVVSPRYGPTLGFALGLGWMTFAIDTDRPPLPNVSYRTVDLQFLEVEQPILRHGAFGLTLHGSFSLLIVLGAGDIESDKSTGYGSASVTGIDLAVGLRASYARFHLDFGYTYRRLSFDFDRECAIQNTGCGEAGGAVEQSDAFLISVGLTL